MAHGLHKAGVDVDVFEARDGIHAMPPAGGEGANTALGDAALLVSHLLAGGTIADTVARYHASMRTTAGAALKRSASYRAQEPSHA